MVKWIGFRILKCNLTPRFDAADIHCGEAAAISESMVSNALHALGDVDGGEAAATFESIVSNARHALGDGDGGEAAATPESFASNARHAIRYAVVGDGGGDGDGAGVLGATRTCHLGHFALGDKVIPDAVDLDCGLRTGHEGQQGGEEEE